METGNGCSITSLCYVTIPKGGSVWACMCGASANFPFCDGSHNDYNGQHGTDIEPEEVKGDPAAEKDVWLCMCGHSTQRPFCSGAHAKVHEVK
mmetsp:Transcript_16496/g.27258  ORF Transcript_16496/g.27258 Transcript_16496/m.27258 type:complete len:93 (-) Transcript_16496:217-495(-)